MRLIVQASKMGNVIAKNLLKPTVPQINPVVEISNPSVEKKDPVHKTFAAHPDDEVITIIGNKLEPIQIFEIILDNIKAQKIYDKRGSTGSRIGDRKCGRFGSQCRIVSRDAWQTSVLSGGVKAN